VLHAKPGSGQSTHAGQEEEEGEGVRSVSKGSRECTEMGEGVKISQQTFQRVTVTRPADGQQNIETILSNTEGRSIEKVKILPCIVEKSIGSS
jgi:hypothetical protein